MMVNGYFILSVVIAYFLGNISPSTIQAKMAGFSPPAYAAHRISV